MAAGVRGQGGPGEESEGGRQGTRLLRGMKLEPRGHLGQFGEPTGCTPSEARSGRGAERRPS